MAIKSVSIRIEEEMLEKIGFIADYEGRSVNSHILVLIRENITDRQRVLSGILRSEHFPNDVYARLQLMMRDVNSLISHADFAFERLDYLHDTVLGLINIEQNKIVKIFTVASVLFLPATLVASIYGMNVDLPGQNLGGMWPFVVACVAMFVVSGVILWFFKIRKWL